MISKETLEECKEALYYYCTTKKYCTYCFWNEHHDEHFIIIGTLRIGVLDVLFKVLDGVLNDTSPQHYRLSECAKYLEANEYIVIKQTNDFGASIFWATPKLIEEQRSKATSQQKIKEWF